MKIRKATVADIPAMMEIFDYGREVQRLFGNPNQWGANYPSEESIKEDIASGHSYVAVIEAKDGSDHSDGTIVATALISPIPDPYYDDLDGQWLSDDPYYVVHRLGSNGKLKGAGTQLLEWGIEQFSNIRIDTHALNDSMRYVLDKLGFIYVGTIVGRGGSPRVAYHIQKEPVPSK